MPTLSDVASAAGVSPTTVSRHLNNSIVLPQATRDRIDAAIARLDYRPNLLAKRLSTGRAEAIGLVTPEIDNPFFAQLAATVEAEAEKHGYAVYMSSTHGDRAREIEAVRRMRDRHVDGMVLITSQPDDGSLAKLLGNQDKVVLLDEDVRGICLPSVFVENERGAYLATRHLIDAGHRHIAYIGGPPGLMSVGERLAGFTRAMAQDGLTFAASDVFLRDYSRSFGSEAAQQIIARKLRPSAIFASSDNLAIGVLQAFRRAGLSVPHDMSLVGFDDMPFAELVNPPLTTIRQPVPEMGRLAFELLLALLNGEPVEPVTRLPLELIERRSVALFTGGSSM
ncbi:LacI family DNA-binding transcriptional regulator [Devosia sp. J2-20]|uniref:LacI family DNA-binding transcriptional regulator n=1 Tax=Devosia litorisediminis TaxID=2829817 RepID=A0A942EB13_9HYPH|nr:MULTISPECIES: LacI family DNA-binding transcriptional regulator [Devosia]MBS3848044.1 LacI family DNA-binding transcriptional regulator [Devosia litorisediminis]WDQ98858.1 LacI family DNA-binding transcriptional regulator [Devosia sp. J2-20]